jgi:hypothetical protein
LETNLPDEVSIMAVEINAGVYLPQDVPHPRSDPWCICYT